MFADGLDCCFACLEVSSPKGVHEIGVRVSSSFSSTKPSSDEVACCVTMGGMGDRFRALPERTANSLCFLDLRCPAASLADAGGRVQPHLSLDLYPKRNATSRVNRITCFWPFSNKLLRVARLDDRPVLGTCSVAALKSLSSESRLAAQPFSMKRIVQCIVQRELRTGGELIRVAAFVASESTKSIGPPMMSWFSLGAARSVERLDPHYCTGRSSAFMAATSSTLHDCHP